MPAISEKPTLGWHQHAACGQMGVELFFDAEDGGSGRAAQESLAKAVCSDCKVRYNCLEHALSSNEKHGIWGGMTTKERLTYKRRVKRLRKVGE